MALNQQEPEDLSDLHENRNCDLDEIVEKTREEVCENGPKTRAMKTFMSKQRLGARLLARMTRGRERAGLGQESQTSALTAGDEAVSSRALAFPCIFASFSATGCSPVGTQAIMAPGFWPGFTHDV